MSSSIDQAILQAEKDAALAAARTPVLGASPGGPGVELLNKDVYVDSTTGSTGVTFAADPGVGVGVPRPTDTSEEPKRRRSRDHDVDGDAKREPLPFLTGSWKMLTGSHLNWLLVFLPVGVAAEVFKWSEGAIFGFNCLAILPLAKLLGDATEQVAMHTNDTIGGLLNATFGNATELIVSLFALFKGLLGVVQVSLLGSIISNTLLVLGCSCIAGGIKKPVQRFNATAASANTTLLLMSILGMSIPACLASLGEMRVGEETDLMISRLTAIILLFLYCLYIYFQLVTHRLYFEGGEGQLANLSLTNLVPGQQVISRTGSQGSFADEEEEEELMFSLRGGLFWLGVITVIIAFLSEFLTGAIEGATKEYNINQSFVGFVILPIVGNAAEHATAITMAYKSKMDLALGVALGSATQISLFVVPVMVLTAWAIGQPLDLFFGAYETVVTFVATVVLGFAVADGETNWLEGASLLSAYVIIACSFLFYEHGYDRL